MRRRQIRHLQGRHRLNTPRLGCLFSRSSRGHHITLWHGSLDTPQLRRLLYFPPPSSESPCRPPPLPWIYRCIPSTAPAKPCFLRNLLPILRHRRAQDFASVIEAEMVLCEQPLARFRITAQSTDGSTSDTRTFSVLYCDRHTDLQPYTIISQQFLTSRRIITASPDAYPCPFSTSGLLSNISTRNSSPTTSSRAAPTPTPCASFFSPDGYTGMQQGYALGMLTLHHAALYEKTAKYNSMPYEILGVTVEIGRRSITIYTTPTAAPICGCGSPICSTAPNWQNSTATPPPRPKSNAPRPSAPTPPPIRPVRRAAVRISGRRAFHRHRPLAHAAFHLARRPHHRPPL